MRHLGFPLAAARYSPRRVLFLIEWTALLLILAAGAVLITGCSSLDPFRRDPPPNTALGVGCAVDGRCGPAIRGSTTVGHF